MLDVRPLGSAVERWKLNVERSPLFHLTPRFPAHEASPLHPPQPPPARRNRRPRNRRPSHRRLRLRRLPKNGNLAAIDAWLAGSARETDDGLQDEAAARMGRIQSLFGRMLGYEVIRAVALSSFHPAGLHRREVRERRRLDVLRLLPPGQNLDHLPLRLPDQCEQHPPAQYPRRTMTRLR